MSEIKTGFVACQDVDHPENVSREVPTWFATHGIIETTVGGIAQKGRKPSGWRCGICARGFPFAPMQHETEHAFALRYKRHVDNG